MDEVYRRLADIDDAPVCHGPMTRIMSRTHVTPDIQPYKSMATGEYIGSRSKHKDHLKRHRLIEVGGETKYLMNPKPPKLDREARKRRIAEILNNR